MEGKGGLGRGGRKWRGGEKRWFDARGQECEYECYFAAMAWSTNGPTGKKAPAAAPVKAKTVILPPTVSSFLLTVLGPEHKEMKMIKGNDKDAHRVVLKLDLGHPREFDVETAVLPFDT